MTMDNDEIQAPTGKNKPVAKFRAGSLTATVWPRSSERVGSDSSSGTQYSVVIDRSYKDKAGKWVTTDHFSAQDLPTVSWLSKRAFEFILDKAK
jgi:hypothetical protein